MQAVQKYQPHPASEYYAFPLLSGKEFDGLVASIKEHGQLDPIVILDGQILEGRNRHAACVELGIEVKTELYTEKLDPYEFVYIKNVSRRQLTKAQMAAAAAKRVNARQGRPEKNKDFATKSLNSHVSVAQAAADAGVSTSAVEKSRVAMHRAPEAFKALEADQLTPDQAYGISRLPTAQQPAALTAKIESNKSGTPRTKPHIALSANRIKWQAVIDAPSIFPVDAVIPKGEGPEERQVREAIRIARENEAGISRFGRAQLQKLIWQNTNCIQGYCDNWHKRPRPEGLLDPRLNEWAKDVARKHQARQLIIQEHEIVNKANGSNGSIGTERDKKKPSKKKMIGFEAVFRRYWQKEKPLLRDLRMYGFETFSERWMKTAAAYFTEVGSK